MSNTLQVGLDADAQAYLDRYPDVRSLMAIYGPGVAKLHYDAHGKSEGRVWGAAQPATQTATAGPAKTAATELNSAMYGNDASSWDAYLKSARSAAEGVNQMPGVFSDYGSVPIEDAAARALFSPQASGQQAGQTPQAAMTALASLAGQSQSVGSMSPSQQFLRILDMGQGAFAEAPGNVFQRQAGMPIDEMEFYQKGYDYYNR